MHTINQMAHTAVIFLIFASPLIDYRYNIGLDYLNSNQHFYLFSIFSLHCHIADNKRNIGIPDIKKDYNDSTECIILGVLQKGHSTYEGIHMI